MNIVKPKVTTAGRNMIAAAVNGDEILFTRIILGDGIFTGDDAAGATDVLSPVEELPISGHSVANNVATLVAIYNNADEQTGFFFREIVIKIIICILVALIQIIVNSRCSCTCHRNTKKKSS